MNRNSLVAESLKGPAAPRRAGVWAMAMAMIGVAFGAPSTRKTGTGR